MSLSNRKDAEVCFRIFPCFVVIEDSKNKLIYITEIQEGRSSLLEYEEINEIPCSDTSMGIKIVGKYPKETVESELRDQWVELCHYKVPLRKLTWVGGKIDLRLDPNMGILEFSLFNIPIFEFEDGFYMLPGHSEYFVKGPPRQMPQGSIKPVSYTHLIFFRSSYPFLIMLYAFFEIYIVLGKNRITILHQFCNISSLASDLRDVL